MTVKLNKVLKILFVAFMCFYIFIIVLFLLPIYQWVLLELYTELPLILPMSLTYYCLVDTFTPNPKHSSLYGWIYAEFLEHLVFPLVLFLSLILPSLFMFTFIFLIYYFYGHILGEIKTFIDALHIVTLVIGLTFLSYFPDITLFINYYISGSGWIFLVIFTLLCSTLYFINKLIISRKMSVLAFMKGYVVFMLGVISVMVTLILVK